MIFHVNAGIIFWSPVYFTLSVTKLYVDLGTFQFLLSGADLIEQVLNCSTYKNLNINTYFSI